MNLNDLPIGTITESMICGHRCPVEIIGKRIDVDDGVIYDVKYLGKRICLDYGQNWYMDYGAQHFARPMNIKAAAEWRAKGY